MPAIHVRDLDDALIAALKARAAAHHRSLTGEVKAILADAVAAPEPRSTKPARKPRRPLKLHTVRVAADTRFSREELYQDD
jgi:plasmid stability protein